jgi:hypothetical protein
MCIHISDNKWNTELSQNDGRRSHNVLYLMAGTQTLLWYILGKVLIFYFLLGFKNPILKF